MHDMIPIFMIAFKIQLRRSLLTLPTVLPDIEGMMTNTNADIDKKVSPYKEIRVS